MQNYKILITTCFLALLAIMFIYLIYTDNITLSNNPSKHSQNPIINMLENLDTRSNKETALRHLLFQNPNSLVFRYVNLPLDYKYGSNSIPLTVATLLTSNDILELGMGLFSTPLLHNIGADLKRQVVSVDTDLEWLSKFKIYNITSNHKIYHLTQDEMNQFGLNQNWGLVLVDHIDAATRSLNAINFSRRAQIVVVHDTEKSQENFYGYERNRIRDSFKYACKYSIFSDNTKSSYISTLIMSNFIQLNDLNNLFSKIKNDFGHVACDVNY